MTFCGPSRKLSPVAVVHVGSLSGVVRRANQTSHQPINFEYELHGSALDVCRQVVTETSNVTETLSIKVTKDAVDDNGDGGWASITLVADSACILVSNDFSLFILISVSQRPMKNRIYSRVG